MQRCAPYTAYNKAPLWLDPASLSILSRPNCYRRSNKKFSGSIPTTVFGPTCNTIASRFMELLAAPRPFDCFYDPCAVKYLKLVKLRNESSPVALKTRANQT